MKVLIPYQEGVTLVELMIVVALVAIIASIAYPSYISHTNKTRNAEAQIMLLEVMQQQRVFFTSNSRYTDDLSEVVGAVGPVVSENGHYLISVDRCEADNEGDPAVSYSDCVLLTATPTFVSASAPPLTYNSRNQKGPTGHW